MVIVSSGYDKQIWTWEENLGVRGRRFRSGYTFTPKEKVKKRKER